MGHSESTFRRSYEDSVSQLSSVQLREITTHFNEVYAKAGGSKGHLVDREAFSKYFKLPVTVGERLFEAFDAQKVSERCKPVLSMSFPSIVLCRMARSALRSLCVGWLSSCMVTSPASASCSSRYSISMETRVSSGRSNSVM